MRLSCFCDSVALSLFLSHRSYKSHGAVENMVDVFGALWTDTAQEILAERILRSPKPNPALVQRVLIHVVSSDRSPSQVCVGLKLTLLFVLSKVKVYCMTYFIHEGFIFMIFRRTIVSQI